MKETACTRLDGNESHQTKAIDRLVCLKAGEPGPAVFFIPGFGGSVGRLRRLGELLVTSMSVFGIEGQGFNGTPLADIDVKVMAGRYWSLIKSKQAIGPYMLVGHSFGGLVAVEVAKHALAAGEKIGCLIVLDSNFAERLWPFTYYLRISTKRIIARFREFLATPPRYRGLYAAHISQIVVRKLGLANSPAKPAIDATVAHQIAFANYDPEFYPGKLIVFRAALKDYPADPVALWTQRTRELEIRPAGGGHLSMLDPPHVASLGREISACLSAVSVNLPKAEAGGF